MKRYFCITLLFMVFSQLVLAKDILDTVRASAQGNWLNTDGSNRWTYGFTRDKVFYDCAVWQVKSVRQIKNHFSECYFKKRRTADIIR
ncbi:hypothetical protein [Arachidicoccus sp.]|uniref:hypothetical protein n=1 Tax=Arachidicoccus sp. TaxID=1872624 RepID=UPI003D1F1C52